MASSTTINIPGSNAQESTGKAAGAVPAPAPAPAAAPAASKKKLRYRGGWKKGVSVFDFILRLVGIGAALAATITMGTTDQTLPFFTQFFQFRASYEDLPALTFFVIANAIASGYLVLSLPFSIITICRPQAVGPRLLLLIFDTVIINERWSCVSGSNCLLGPHWELQSKLDSNLPAIRRLLPEHQWRRGCFLRCSHHLHALGCHVCFSPPKALNAPLCESKT